ncbi:MAG: response regulator [Candidatus Margulisiibacteriota bacterium]|nr:MAG: hypothetical protein A2X43_13355 [Candidatus Margulisbacteria bacterium GWD2_39_127]OGI04756.1 MAG: hypothetical protein A2X42_10640 [Candidatus Margulisbacteria bacterium GWF2_38_17]OGI05701.1 MAG: hypothetical protein A2X41_03225 [Candidatus Margulisbacteria bacterium GWE2_39_32]PZM83635.1 MAG: response regulator [Candidatus Margulisiibacteriota bacterium]HAR62053.1 response regulator [Candidatus Margulisiibacteriota bacterium]
MDHKFKILIIDDMAVIRTILRVALYNTADMVPEQIYEAGNGKEALELLSKQKVDLIFSDINMPQMDGIAFLKELNARGIKIPVVVLSTVESKDKIIEAIKLGAIKFIHKPFHSEDLKEVIDKVILDK